jgi:hypothetical protein
MNRFLIRLHTMYGLAEGKAGNVTITPTTEIVDFIEWIVEETDYEPTDLVFPVEGKGWCIPGDSIGIREDFTGHSGHMVRTFHILEVTDDTLAVHIKLKFGFNEAPATTSQ